MHTRTKTVEAKKPNRQKRRRRKATRGKSNAAPDPFENWRRREPGWEITRRKDEREVQAALTGGTEAAREQQHRDRGGGRSRALGARVRSAARKQMATKSSSLRHHDHGAADAARVRAPGPAHTRNLPGSPPLQRDGYLDFAGYHTPRSSPRALVYMYSTLKPRSQGTLLLQQTQNLVNLTRQVDFSLGNTGTYPADRERSEPRIEQGNTELGLESCA